MNLKINVILHANCVFFFNLFLNKWHSANALQIKSRKVNLWMCIKKYHDSDGVN